MGAKDQQEDGVMSIKSTPSRINNAFSSKETSLEMDKLMRLSPKRSKEPEEPSLKKAPALPLVTPTKSGTSTLPQSGRPSGLNELEIYVFYYIHSNQSKDI